jgi:hypothetical protein
MTKEIIMARMDAYEAAIADVAIAIKKAESALKRFNSAEPLGKTARVLNPRQRLLDALAEGCSALKGCEEEYGKMLEAAAIEGSKGTGTKGRTTAL